MKQAASLEDGESKFGKFSLEERSKIDRETVNKYLGFGFRGYRNVKRFRGGLAFKAHRICVLPNSRLESNKEEEEEFSVQGLWGRGMM